MIDPRGFEVEGDRRVGVARRALAFSWTFFTLFLAAMIGTALLCGNEPRLLGLPRWAAWTFLFIPIAFVAALIPLVERVIPDVPLGDDGEESP